jgi:predicted AAA+ superfamily ATPase
MGAVLIEGPKVVGKTETALEIAQSVVRLDIDHVARTLAQTDPTLLFAGEVPRLIDEWQLEVGIWPHLRLELTERKVPGQFILTGSSVPDDDKMRDTGAGRIMRMKMRPMTLLETGHSEGTVSLSSLFAQNFTTVPAPTLTLQEVTDRVCVGGWPLFYKLPVVDAQTAMISYLSDIAGLDVQRVSGVNYHKDNVLKVLQSLARNVGTKASNKTIAADVGPKNAPLDQQVTADYLTALERVMVTENSPPWTPKLRTAARINGSPTRFFIDPALAVAALGTGPTTLLGPEIQLLGFLFENLVVRDLRVYMQSKSGSVRQYRDSYGNEVDAILELRDGIWGAVEIKLGQGQVDAAAASLLKFRNEVIDTTNTGAPQFLAVITATGPAYLRPDGVYVLSIGQLCP